jgi:hypothetical protein
VVAFRARGAGGGVGAAGGGLPGAWAAGRRRSGAGGGRGRGRGTTRGGRRWRTRRPALEGEAATARCGVESERVRKKSLTVAMYARFAECP